MSISLRLGLLIASLSVLIFIIVTVIHKRLNIRYSIVWILWALMSLLMAIFPEIFYGLSDLLGIQMPVNTVFLIMTALLYALTFYVYITMTKQTDQIVKLTYEVAYIKKQLEEAKKNGR